MMFSWAGNGPRARRCCQWKVNETPAPDVHCDADASRSDVLFPIVQEVVCSGLLCKKLNIVFFVKRMIVYRRELSIAYTYNHCIYDDIRATCFFENRQNAAMELNDVIRYLFVEYNSEKTRPFWMLRDLCRGHNSFLHRDTWKRLQCLF